MIKLGSNFFLVLKDSMSISGSNKWKKGMLSVAEFMQLWHVNFRQPSRLISTQVKTALLYFGFMIFNIHNIQGVTGCEEKTTTE